MSSLPKRLGLEIDKINYKFKNLLRFLLLFSVINFETKQNVVQLVCPLLTLIKSFLNKKWVVYFGKKPNHYRCS